MAIQQSELIEVRNVKGKGRGVFARTFISAGTEIERVPMLVVPESATYGTVLSDYAFFWGKGTVALALGYGSIYNHSYKPNARYEDYNNRTKGYIAIKDIPAGEEITINYNGDPTCCDPVDFDVLE